MEDLTLEEALEALSTAEDFLDYFKVAYEESVVQVNRLHILQRFHDYLTEEPNRSHPEESLRYTAYQQSLQRAYQDFVHSDALNERVFKVLKEAQNPGEATMVFIPTATRSD